MNHQPLLRFLPHTSGFPTGIENMGGAVPRPLIGGGLFKIWWGGLKSIHGKSMGGALNAVEKMGALVLMGGGFKKNCRMPPVLLATSTMGNPVPARRLLDNPDQTLYLFTKLELRKNWFNALRNCRTSKGFSSSALLFISLLLHFLFRLCSWENSHYVWHRVFLENLLYIPKM